MGSNDMNHLGHLESIALADVNVLHMKEGTYKGSWKKAGGRSAWFMARRNIDRLLTMMLAPDPEQVKSALSEFDRLRLSVVQDSHAVEVGFIDSMDIVMKAMRAEDIFAMITAEPTGKDGTVLAVIRDLRRYLMLVEAEMVSEGVVEPEHLPAMYYERPQTDVYQMIADEHKLTRDEVKRRIHELFYSPLGQPPVTASGGRYVADQARRHGEQQNHDKTPSLVPWQIDRAHCESLAIRVGDSVSRAFYSQRGPDLWQLDPVVESHTCPRELSSVMRFAGQNRWIISREQVPAELEDNYPRLQLEMNQFEHESSNPDFKFMYEQDHSDGKFKLMQTFEAWGRAVG